MEMYCRKVQPIAVGCIVFGIVCHTSLGFTPSNIVKRSTRNTNCRNIYSSRPESSLARTRLLGRTKSDNNNPTSLTSTRGNDNDRYNDDDMIIVMDWECIVDSLPYYTQLGVDAARTVWPHLNDLCDDNDMGWVENKLAAISHVLSPPSSSSSLSISNQHHPACEYALATRLILEEQALDQNQSTGKSGKYARRFHPREELPLSRVNTRTGQVDNDTNDNSNDISNSSTGSEYYYRPAVSTRPLTVGEMAVNWRDSIRDTLQLRYNCNSKDPIPVLDATIQEAVRGLQLRSQSLTRQQQILQLFPQTKFALSNTAMKVLIQTRHDTDFESLVQSLKNNARNNNNNDNYYSNNVRFQTASSVDDAMSCNQNNGVVILRPMNDSGTKGNVLRQVLQHSSSTSKNAAMTTVTYVDSSWHRIQDHIVLFGDSIPRHGTNRAKCIVPGRFLSLYLAEWPGTVHPEESKNVAILNPWTDSISWEQTELMLVPPWSGSTFQ